MQTILFSKKGIHYQDSGTGTIKAIFVPASIDTQKFLDITNPGDSSIKQRCPEIVGIPLYRKTGEAVHVYGEVANELLEKRQGVEIILPQDLAPKNCSVFYYVFGKDYIVHGVKKVNDNGETSWGTSLIDVKDKDLNKIIVSSASDRMLVGDEENICVASQGSDLVRENLQEALKVFDISVDKFSSLSVPNYIPPVYAHKDYSIVMLTIVIFSFLLMAGTTAYFVRNTVKLSSIEDEISGLRSEINKMQDSRKLGYIKNPKKILDRMKQPLKQQPSAVINAVAGSASNLGDLNSLSFSTVDNPGKKEGQIIADIKLDNIKSSMLVDQERLAAASIVGKPWVRKIELSGGKSSSGKGKSLPLKVWVQVE